MSRWLRTVACFVSASFAVAAFAVPDSSAQPLTTWEWRRQEVADYFAGAREVQLSGWGRLNAKVQKIVDKLIHHSGMVFRVVPAQTGAAGQAHNGGWILLDLSIVVNDSKRPEFWLAHEWGHEALGHAANYVHPTGRPRSWQFNPSSTADEDSADEYAGAFLCAEGYAIDPVAAMLRTLPVSPRGDVHSTGEKRAKTVVDAYVRAGCPSGQHAPPPVTRTVQPPTSTPASNETWASCHSRCQRTKSTCASAAKSRNTACVSGSRSPAVLRCNCPNWPTGALACYDVCSSFADSYNDCSRAGNDDTDACDDGMAACKQNCDVQSARSPESVPTETHVWVPADAAGVGPGKWEVHETRMSSTATSSDGFQRDADTAAEARKNVVDQAMLELQGACASAATRRYSVGRLKGTTVVDRDLIVVSTSCHADEDYGWVCRANNSTVSGDCTVRYLEWVPTSSR
jgi:hypothetical protein